MKFPRYRMTRSVASAALFVALLYHAMPALAEQGANDREDPWDSEVFRHDEDGSDKVWIGRSFRVERGEKVSELVAIGSNGEIHGEIGELVLIGSRVRLGPTAVVRDELVVLGSSLDRDAGAKITAKEVSVALPMEWGFWERFADRVPRLWWPAQLVWTIAFFLVALGLGWLFFRVAPEVCLASSRYLAEHAATSFFTGLVWYLLLVPGAVFLAISVVGIPLIPLYIIVAVLLVLMGIFSLAHWVGMRLPFSRRLEGMAALAAGLAVILVVKLVPFFGSLVFYVGSMFGMGAITQTLYRHARFGGARPPEDRIGA